MGILHPGCQDHLFHGHYWHFDAIRWNEEIWTQIQGLCDSCVADGPLCCVSLINGLLLHSKLANKVQYSEVWLYAWTTLHRSRVSGAKCLAQLFRLCVMIGMVFHAALLRSMQVAFAASWRRHANRRKYMERSNGFTVWSYRKFHLKEAWITCKSLKLCTKRTTNNNSDTCATQETGAQWKTSQKPLENVKQAFA